MGSRKLTKHSELYQSAMHTNDFYRGNLVACRYAIPPELQPVSAQERLKRIVDNAITEVALKHPILQVGILNVDSKKPAWISLEGLDMQRHIEWRYPGSSEELDNSHSSLIASQLDIRCENLENMPGWRTVILYPLGSNHLEIIFAYNHANGDGTSGRVFHQDLLQSLQTITTEAARRDWDIPLPLVPQPISKLPPPTERWIKLKLSGHFIAGGVWNAYKPSVFNKSPTLAHWSPIRTSPYKTNVHAFSIGSDTLSKTLIACRRWNTTVTGLFHGLALVAFASHIDAAIAPAFEGGTPVCMRRFLPSPHPDDAGLIPDRTIANYVTMLSHKFNVDVVTQIRSQLRESRTRETGSLSPALKKLIWDQAKSVRGDISRRINGGVKNEPVGLMKFVPDWRPELREKAEKPRQLSWTVTNIGVMDNGKRESSEAQTGWSLRRAQLGVSAEVPGPAMFIAPMSVAGEQMCVSCTWQDCIMDKRIAEGIALSLEKLLVQVVESVDP
jgi:hypothetical protein